MKKMLFLALAMLIAMPMMNAKSSISKDVKAVTKDFKKGKWELDGTAKSVETVYTDYLTKTQDAKFRAFQASAQTKASSSLNLAQNSALNNAINLYAQEQLSYIRGRVNSEMGQMLGEEMDNFYAAYERLVAAMIAGELKFQFAKYRIKGDQREYVAYYIINTENEEKKAEQAAEKAINDAKLSMDQARRISAFVQEGFQSAE